MMEVFNKTNAFCFGALRLALTRRRWPYETSGMAGHRTYHTGLLALAQGAAPFTIPKAVGNAGIAIMSHEAAYGSSNEGRRSGKRPMTANPSVEATNCSKLQFAPHLER
jgi:hypothetical protein